MATDLFNVALNELSAYISGIDSRKLQKRLHFALSHNDKVWESLFNNAENSVQCCLPVPGRPNWNPENRHFVLEREASERGVIIERFLLLPFKHLINDPVVQKHIILDEKSGIKVRKLFIGNLLKDGKLPFNDSLEYSIFDQQVIFIKYYSDENHSPIEFVVSANGEDIEVGQTIWNLLLQNSVEIGLEESQSQLSLEEPMLSTAPVADFLSKVLCKGNHINSDDCQWYHSIWQYLRILDVVSTPTWHASFYNTQLHAVSLAHNSKISILISGTADYSTLAHALWAFKDYSEENLDISVLDLCDTPLFLCKWYASLSKRKITTLKQDIFTLTPTNCFNLIVTDAFLTRFSLEDRKEVVKKWHSLLSKDGYIITTVRLGGNPAGEPRKGSQIQSEEFGRNIRNIARHWRDFLPISIDELERRGKIYASLMTSYSAGNASNILSLFEDNGFQIIAAVENEVKGELLPTTYIDIMAKKI